MELDSSRQMFEKSSNIKFHENPCSWSRVVSCGLTDMTEIVVAFRDLMNAFKNVC